MSNKTIRKIDVGLDLPIYECLLSNDESFSDLKPTHEDPQDETFQFFKKLYYNEDVMIASGIPIIPISKGRLLYDLETSVTKDPYKIPEDYVSFTDTLNMGRATNNGVVCVKDIEGDESVDRLTLQKGGYFDFKKTNVAADMVLGYYGHPPDATMRNFEITDGRAISYLESRMCNLLGAAFVVTASNDQGDKYLIFTPRGKNRSVHGGTIGVTGMVPQWDDDNFVDLSFENYIRNETEREMKEELNVDPESFEIRTYDLVNDLGRGAAPSLSLNVEVTGKSIEEIASNCFEHQDALEEHSKIYTVPKPESLEEYDHTLNALVHTAGFNINAPTRFGMQAFSD